jgi:hypothetical protein
MNKKLINELAEKAYFLIENDKIFAPDGFDSINYELLDFAQLIINECVGICMIEYDTGLEMAPQAPWIAKQIKDHFGVD